MKIEHDKNLNFQYEQRRKEILKEKFKRELDDFKIFYEIVKEDNDIAPNESLAIACKLYEVYIMARA